jgi:YfiH family protein
MLILQSRLLSNLPQIGHAFLGSAGGSSQGPYAELNLSYWVGDQADCVTNNWDAVRRELGIQQIQLAHQVHGTSILCADGLTHPICGEGDGLFTREPGRAVAVLHADCQPILVADPVRGAVLAVHAGWRGLMSGVLLDGIRELERIGSQSRDLVMVIGPSLGPCSAQFVKYQEEFPSWAWSYRREDDLFDLWAIAADQAQGAGVPRQHIEILGIDTRLDPRFFSYRRASTTGRNASLVWLR